MVSALVTPEALNGLDGLSTKERAVAVGQHFTAREAAIVAAAMSYCVTEGVPVLPVHDSLIVPASKAHVARRGLTGAFLTLAGVRVALKG